MNATVCVLTPPGAAAIAVVEVAGPDAWEIVRAGFRPSGAPLPDAPTAGLLRFGRFVGDDVVLSVRLLPPSPPGVGGGEGMGVGGDSLRGDHAFVKANPPPPPSPLPPQRRGERGAGIELHCHGGPVVVDWIVEQLHTAGAERIPWTDPRRQSSSTLTRLAERRLTLAPTLRTAAICSISFMGRSSVP